MAEVIQLENLDTYIALAVEKVNNGVALARAGGVQAELPSKLDFELVVIVPDGWQALEERGTETGTNKETGGTTDTGDTDETVTGSDDSTTTETQGGYQEEKSDATTTDDSTTDDDKDSAQEEHHTQNTDETVTEE